MVRVRVLVLGLIALLIALPLVLLIVLPLELRAGGSGAAAHGSAAAGTPVHRLVVITPHGEPTRAEFGRAFTAWCARERGTVVEVDWLTPGGTSEIQRYFDEFYGVAVKRARPDWSGDLVRGARDSGSDQPDAALLPRLQERHPDWSAERIATLAADLRAARKDFLASDIGCGIDVYFGGGEFAFRTQADKGYLVDDGLRQREPTWFTPEVMPQSLSGETVWDPKGRYYGACLAVFGIASSVDRLRDLGLEPPTRWHHLAEPAYLHRLTLADPMKSGAVVTTMERILQQTMAERAAASGSTTASPEALAAGWVDGLNLIKRLVANSRALTDSASKPTRDTVRGDCVASMAIDFQAKAEAAWSAEESGGPPRLAFTVPVGGTSVSPDPIAVLRGAPEAELARDFVRFVLSPEGQRLWSYRRGVPGGPERYELHRMPVRADVYTAVDRERMSHPDDDPYAIARSFTFRPAWTGKVYGLIGPVVKAVAMDSRDELTSAWTAIVTAGGPARVPEAMAVFERVPFAYGEVAAVGTTLKAGPAAALPLQRQWVENAIAQYREAERLARAGR